MSYYETERDKKIINSLEDIAKCLKEIKDSLDVVDVVRCKDCKYLTIINDGEVYARCEQTSFEFQPFGTNTRVHYCGYGERREK